MSAQSLIKFSPRIVGISAICIAALSSAAARASELFSESVFVPPLPTTFEGKPVSGWDSFNILLDGSETLPAQNASDPNTDPFADNGGTSTITTGAYSPVATDAGVPVGPGFITLQGLNRIRFTGTVPINQANIPNQGLANPTDEVQFGVVGPTDNTPLRFYGQHWNGSYTNSGTLQLNNYLHSVPLVTILPNPAPPAAPPQGTSFDYIVDFVQFTQDGISGSEWAEFPYLPGQQPTFNYGGWADWFDPIHFTNHEIQLSSTEIPLDDLNFADDPPTGLTSMPAFSEAALPADVVPEPAAGFLAVIGVTGIIARRRRKPDLFLR
jgi:hypothetical protein